MKLKNYYWRIIYVSCTLVEYYLLNYFLGSSFLSNTLGYPIVLAIGYYMGKRFDNRRFLKEKRERKFIYEQQI